MKTRRLWASVGAAAWVMAGVVGCNGNKEVVSERTAEVKTVQHTAYFDVATCGQRPMGVAGMSPATLKGYLASLEPWVRECLVDERHRGAEAKTQVTVELTVASNGAHSQVHGDNVTAAGARCIQQTVDRLSRGLSPDEDGTLVKAQLEYTHDKEHQPTTILTADGPTRFVSVARLKFTDWCDCFVPWKSRAPRSLFATITVSPRGAHATVEPTNDSGSDLVAECMERKLGTLTPQETGAPKKEVTFATPLYFIHSGVSETLMGSPPAVQWAQLAAVEQQRAAEVTTREATRRQTFAHFKEAKASAHPAYKREPATDLTEPCGEVVKSDDSLVAARSRQLEMYEQSLYVLSDLKAKDAAWGKQETQAKAGLTAVKSAYEKAKAQRDTDQDACERL